MVYVLKGWVKTYMEGQGETLMQEGSCWSQPPRHQASDPRLLRELRIAGGHPARGVPDRRTRGVTLRHPGSNARRRHQLSTPTIAPIRQVVSVPETIDFNPSELISSRRCGAMVPRPPIMMPRLPKLAKPHIA